MNPPKRLRVILLGAALASTLAFTGCASLTPKTPEEQVKELAGKRWDTLIAGKWEEAYAMLAPSYRAVTPIGAYRSSFSGNAAWTKVKVHSVECSTASSCKARVIVSISMPAATRDNQDLSAPLNETWVEEEGRWWLLDQ